MLQLRWISVKRNEWQFIWACAFLFAYSLAGEYFSSELLDQSKHKYISIFALSANAFQSDQIEDGC